MIDARPDQNRSGGMSRSGSSSVSTKLRNTGLTRKLFSTMGCPFRSVCLSLGLASHPTAATAARTTQRHSIACGRACWRRQRARSVAAPQKTATRNQSLENGCDVRRRSLFVDDFVANDKMTVKINECLLDEAKIDAIGHFRLRRLKPEFGQSFKFLGEVGNPDDDRAGCVDFARDAGLPLRLLP